MEFTCEYFKNLIFINKKDMFVNTTEVYPQIPYRIFS